MNKEKKENANDPFSELKFELEDTKSLKYDMDSTIEMNGMADKDGLKFEIAFNPLEISEVKMKDFAVKYKANLLKVINHCVKKEKEISKRGFTAIDYYIMRDNENYLAQINQEKWQDLTVSHNYRHILLTGSTGFLGAYLVFELLNSTRAALYLPVRGITQKKVRWRLKKKLDFYFGKDFYNSQKDRIFPLQADLSEDHLGLKDSQYEILCEKVDAVIHPAANVKQHGLYEDFYKDNVRTTENLLEFAVIGKKKDFHHVSTLCVGSGDIPGREYAVFTEYCHDMGQENANVYIKSKLEAEKRVLAYRQKGINVSIYRVGNLIFNSGSGKFQENIGDDYFYAIIRGAVKLEFLSENMKKIIFDMSFIDYTARAIVQLLTREKLKNETYHLCNPNKLSMKEMAGFLRELGIHLNDVKQADVDDYLSKFVGNYEYEKIVELLKLHSCFFEEVSNTQTIFKMDRTVNLLGKLNFQWPNVNRQHIERMITHCKAVGFF